MTNAACMILTLTVLFARFATAKNIQTLATALRATFAV